MRISVALASYNGAAHIRGQLDSLAAQTARIDELVVCDDASTDGTPALVEEFAARAPFPVRLFRNERNLGFGGNFARALGLCTGDLVFLSDQDDHWFPEKIAVIGRLAEGRPDVLMWMNDCEMADASLAPSGLTMLRQIEGARLPPESLVHGCCGAVRRELLELALPFPGGVGHDSWLAELAESLGARRIHPVPLQYYRMHGNNTSGYFLNSTEKVGLLGKVRRRLAGPGRREAMQELSAEEAKLGALETRLRQRLERQDRGPLERDRLERALSALSGKRAAFRRRGAMMGKPKLPRALSGLAMLANGDYRRHFNGCQSFIRDLLV